MKQDKTASKKPAKGSEDLYKALYDSVHDGIYRSTPDGKILTANPALVKMLGYESEEELRKYNIGKEIYARSEDRNNFLKQIESKGRLSDTELILHKKDGTEIVVIENSHAVYDDKGEVLYYAGTLTEITERKRAENALKESEARYHNLLETIQDGISLFDFTGKLLYFNGRKKKMLGYKSSEELMKVNTFEMIHPDDREKVSRVFQELISHGHIYNKIFKILRKDGTWFWADFSATIIKDFKGAPLYIMDSMKDITGRKIADEQLQILKYSIDIHFDGAYWMDSDGILVYVNDSGCRITGYTRDELIGKHVSLINPQANEEIMKHVWDRLRKNGSFTAETTHRRKDGSTYPVEIVTSYIRFEGKEYNCGFARDITDRKKAAEETKLRLEQLHQIMDLVPSYIFAKDIDGKFILANKALAEIFGLTPQEIQGKDDGDYGATREQVAWYRKHDMEVIRKGTPLFIPEEQVLRKDGTLGLFQTVKIPYRHPGYEKPAILGVATEITERKAAEDELRKSEKRFRKLFDSDSAVKLLINPDTKEIVDANRAAADFYGYPVSKLKKMKLTEISTSPLNVINNRFERAGSRSGIVFDTENRLADGTLRDVEVYSTRIELDGSPFIHSIVHDITEKKKMFRDLIAAKEKAEQSDRLKTAFLHNISHEIRTPMNAIVGFTSLLDAPGLSNKAKKQYTDIIIQSSNQLLSIISDIVDISNLETGQVKLNPVKTDLNKVMKSIYDQYTLIARQKKIGFSCNYGLKKADAIIITDETKLKQILSNLVDNAFKFTVKGTVEMGYEKTGKLLVFRVKDTGIGIRNEYLPVIFDRFYQIESRVNQKTEGTGLGLSICKGYLNLLGGKIWAESEPDEGSNFQFSIPYKRLKK